MKIQVLRQRGRVGGHSVGGRGAAGVVAAAGGEETETEPLTVELPAGAGMLIGPVGIEDPGVETPTLPVRPPGVEATGNEVEDPVGAELVWPGGTITVLDGQSFPPIPGTQLETALGEEVVVPGQLYPLQGTEVDPGGTMAMLDGQSFPPLPGTQLEEA